MDLTLNSDRRTAIIVTVVFHIILLLLFMIFGLRTPNPLPEPDGASIELGWVESSSGDGGTPEPTVAEPTSTPITEQVVSEEEVVTEEAETIAVPDEPVEKPEETKPAEEKPAESKPVEQKPSEELSNAAANVFGNNPGSPGDGDNDDAKPGDSGNPNGTPDGHGVMGGTGNSWSLSGRGYEGGAVVTEKPREEGKVVLKIWVGTDGKVNRTSLDMRNSTTTSQHLVALAEKAARKARFNADASANVEQQGSMTFVFKLE